MMLATPEDIGKNNPFNILICFNTNVLKQFLSLKIHFLSNKFKGIHDLLPNVEGNLHDHNQVCSSLFYKYVEL